MLAALLLAALFGPPVTRGACPALPLEAFVTTARVCDALEVTGHVDPSGVSLDPAYDVRIAPSALTRPVPGNAVLTGYTADGHTLFSVPFEAAGKFTLELALAPQPAAALNRLTLTANNATFERVATAVDVPTCEAFALDDAHVLFVWNADSFPAVRVSYREGEPAVYSFRGTTTWEQITIGTTARTFIASFSDGVRSIDRTVNVLAR
jgi:hypothetical protein